MHGSSTAVGPATPSSERCPSQWSTVSRGRSVNTTARLRISGIGKTIRIKSIHVHYDLTVPAESREATERALAAHPLGCPAHQSVKDAIRLTWSATLKAGGQVFSLREEGSDVPAA